MAPHTYHQTQVKMIHTDMTSTGGIRRKTAPQACTTPPRSFLNCTTHTRTSPSRTTSPRISPHRTTPPRTSPSRTMPPRTLIPRNMARKMVKLWVAVEEGDVHQVAQLVQEVGPAVTRDSSGCTLLHVAAANNQPRVVEWLLQLLSPNLVNKAGLTPAHLAAMKGHTQVLSLLLADPHLDHRAHDPAGNTFHHWLCVPLFEAVLRWNEKKVQELVDVGADPDLDGGRVVGGALIRELKITTARHLAITLCRGSILKVFPKQTPLQQQPDTLTSTPFITSTQEGQIRPIDQLSMGSLRLRVPATLGYENKRCVGNDVYDGSSACVTILSYSSFKDRPDLHLPSSHTGTHNLAGVFDKLGYSGNAHFDLTAQETRQVMTRVRNMEELDHLGCAIFVVTSHGTPDQHFLTSDGHLLDTQWLCELFRDSQCPHLKNKPKLFIFDLCCGYYKQEGDNGRGQDTRVKEPLRDTVCLYSNSGELTWFTSSKDGTPFSRSLCHTLAHHSHQELDDLYRHFLTYYTNMAPMAASHLRNVGFTKKFYFTPELSSN